MIQTKRNINNYYEIIIYNLYLKFYILWIFELILGLFIEKIQIDDNYLPLLDKNYSFSKMAGIARKLFKCLKKMFF
jgi:hypothetical protein